MYPHVGFAFLGYRIPNQVLVADLLAIILGQWQRKFAKILDTSNGDWSIFIKKPVSAVFLIFTLIAVIFPVVMNIIRARRATEVKR